MEAVIIVLLLVVVGVVFFFVWEGRESRRRLEEKLESQRQELAQSVTLANQSLQQQVQGLDQRVSHSLDSVQSSVSRSLGATTETIGKIGEQLGELGQSAARIMEVGRQVSSLQDVLQPPKLRGNFGELLLEQLLTQILPAAFYETQFRFKNGDIVDAIIRTPEGLVPIDSKFPIDSFRRLMDADGDDERARQRRAFIRDVRARIEEVAKYVRPEENTLDFALMYVPAENVYYETIIGADDESPMAFALDQRVHLVSPNTFHAFLQVVARGFRGLQVEQNAKEIIARLGQLQREFDKFRQEFDVLGTHVGRAKNKYDDLDKLANRLSDRLEAQLPELSQPSLPEPGVVDGDKADQRGLLE